MGNADLRELAAIEPTTFEEIAGSVVAVDAHNWLYRYLTTTVKWTSESVYTTSTGAEVANLIGVVQGLPKLFAHGITPVFVFDGGVTGLKSKEVERRRAERERAAERAAEAREAGDAIEAARLEARTQRLTDTIHETSRELLSLLDVPVVEAPAEGEAQAAHMARAGTVEYAGTEDYDALLFGAPRTLRGLTSKGDPECMSLRGTLDEHGLTWEQLVDVGLLCGTDFNEGVAGVGPKTAVELVREHGDLWGALEAREAYVEGADLVRELFLNPDATDVDGFDAELDPDVAAARTYVVEEWEIPASEVARGLERIEESVVQSGLDRWT